MKYFITVLSALIFLSACDDSAEKTEQRKDSSSVVTTPTEISLPKLSANTEYDELASYISGIRDKKYTTISDTLLNDSTWVQYTRAIEKNWKKYDESRLTEMRKWRDQELGALYNDTTTLFYPFSGPDFLHAHTFYPKANRYVLIGLEPVGYLPTFDKKHTVKTYLGLLNTSLNSILNFSFFRTVDMKEDYEEYGTLNPMLLFLKRTGHTIAGVQPLNIDSTGKAIVLDESLLKAKIKKSYSGVRILFFGADSVLKTMEYYSVDLSNYKSEENAGMLMYAASLKPFNTYLKSASNLMHKEYFSNIRSVIVENSKSVFQDDSGVPYRFFPEDKWNAVLYGKYTGTIDLFTVGFQKDLVAAYQDSTKNVKPLPFGIGYKHRKGESNLMLFTRK